MLSASLYLSYKKWKKVRKNARNRKKRIIFASRKSKRRDARVAEEARLESVYTPKGYPGFESRSLRRKTGFKAFFLKGLRSLRRKTGFKAFFLKDLKSLRRKTGFKAFFLKGLRSLRRKTGFKAFFLKGLRRTQNLQFLKGLRRKGDSRFLVSQTHYYIIYSEKDLSWENYFFIPYYQPF